MSRIQIVILVEVIKTMAYCIVMIMQRLEIVQVVHLKSAIHTLEQYFPNE